jgi:hypothetical protein
MQIDYGTLKKYTWQILVVICIAIIFLQRSCNSAPNEYQKVEVKIPEKKGVIETATKVIIRKQKDSIIYKKGQVIYTENPINKELAERFKELQKKNDSLALFKQYISAIEKRKQTTIFNDSVVKIEIDTEVEGTLLSIKPKYTVKATSVVAEIKKERQVFALYAGVGISDNKFLSQFTAQGEIGIQLKSGNILSVTADTRQNFGIKFTKQIFKINK